VVYGAGILKPRVRGATGRRRDGDPSETSGVSRFIEAAGTSATVGDAMSRPSTRIALFLSCRLSLTFREGVLRRLVEAASPT
jgi:hypothetical protein